MTLVKNILEYTEKIAPLNTQAQWDNSGFLVGDLNTSVKKVLVALDITEAVVSEAVKLGCQLIISHHPVIFSPLSQVHSNSIVYKLIKAGVSALCLHTNLDVAENIGVNAQLAKALNLDDVKLYAEDFLCVGKLPKTMSGEEFALHVKEALSCNGVRYTKGSDISIVAVSSGGGSEAVTLKEKYGFDAVVTGEIKHHHFLHAVDNNFCAVEAGHFNTEDVVISPLIQALSEEFPDITFLKSSALKDPVNFI